MVNILARKALLTQLSISRWGARRFDDGARDEVTTKHGAKRDVALVTKRLLAKEAMADIHRIAGQARVYHAEHTQPWKYDGVGILPTALYTSYGSWMGEKRDEFFAAVAKFVADYPRFVKEAEKELGTLFKQADYPTNVRSEFSFSITFFPMPDSSDFRCDLDADDLKALKIHADGWVDEQLRESMSDVGQRITTVVGNLSKRLKAYKPADKKKGKKAEHSFRDSLVEHVKELAELLPAFNLADDPKLANVTKAIQERLADLDPEVLRESTDVRKKAVKEADDILKKVAEFLS